MEEWTKAEIGVGAAIAIGSQAENGNWALFEQAATNKKIKIIKEYSEFILNLQFEDNIIIPIDKRIRISPIRFLSKVIVPEAADEKFW